MDSGYLTMTYPAMISLEEIDEVERVLEITVKVMRRTAQAIEARRATTPQSGVVGDESAVANGDAPEQGQPSGTSTENGDG
jgi:hypothetical protein